MVPGVSSSSWVSEPPPLPRTSNPASRIDAPWATLQAPQSDPIHESNPAGWRYSTVKAGPVTPRGMSSAANPEPGFSYGARVYLPEAVTEGNWDGLSQPATDLWYGSSWDTRWYLPPPRTSNGSPYSETSHPWSKRVGGVKTSGRQMSTAACALKVPSVWESSWTCVYRLEDEVASSMISAAVTVPSGVAIEPALDAEAPYPVQFATKTSREKFV